MRSAEEREELRNPCHILQTNTSISYSKVKVQCKQVQHLFTDLAHPC